MTSKFIKQTVGLFGSAVCEGQIRVGTELAPKALREGGLLSALYNLGWQVMDHGDLSKKTVKQLIGEQKNQFKNSQLLGLINHQISLKAKEIAQQNQFMLNIGGDHGVASGSIHGMLEVYGQDLRVVWVDAHADINYVVHPKRNYHGMPVAHLMGQMTEPVKGFEWLTHNIKPENIIYIGLRDVDNDEREKLRELNIQCFTMNEITEDGIGHAIKETINKFVGKPIHISFDVDAIDPEFAHGTGTLVDGGITYREAHYMLRKLAQTGQVVGLDLVEINPLLEKSPEPREEFFGDFQTIGKIQGTQTVALGIELVASAMGRTLI